jgi:hypothetical protein
MRFNASRQSFRFALRNGFYESDGCHQQAPLIFIREKPSMVRGIGPAIPGCALAGTRCASTHLVKGFRLAISVSPS